MLRAVTLNDIPDLHMYDVFLFDLDGTLTDPAEGITNSVAYALAKYGIEVEDRSSLNTFIGPPLADSFAKYYGFGPEQAKEAIVYYREYFAPKGIFENVPYEGIEEVLRELKARGKVLAVATSKAEAFAERIMDHFGLAQYFDLVCGATMDLSRSLKGDVIAYALDRIRTEGFCTKEDPAIVMVGDREHDILGAKENGLPSIGVLYGYGSLEELKAAGADHIISSPVELLEF